MAREVTSTVYTFDELSDSAKERARDWWRECENQDFDTSFMYEDFEQVAKILGITFDTRPVKLMGGGTRYESKIYWSGFSSQGDGACFEGSYEYNLDCARKIRQHAPQDAKLHAIADGLVAIQKKHFYKITAKVKHGRGNYYHAYSMDVDVYKGDYETDAETAETVTELMRDFANWMYRQLERNYEYRMEDEQVDENIRANEYEFDEQGHIS